MRLFSRGKLIVRRMKGKTHSLDRGREAFRSASQQGYIQPTNFCREENQLLNPVEGVQERGTYTSIALVYSLNVNIISGALYHLVATYCTSPRHQRVTQLTKEERWD